MIEYDINWRITYFIKIIFANSMINFGKNSFLLGCLFIWKYDRRTN